MRLSYDYQAYVLVESFGVLKSNTWTEIKLCHRFDKVLCFFSITIPKTFSLYPSLYACVYIFKTKVIDKVASGLWHPNRANLDILSQDFCLYPNVRYRNTYCLVCADNYYPPFIAINLFM